MEGLFNFDPITVHLPGDKVYRRMGYIRGVTACSKNRQKEIDEAIDEAVSLCRLKGSAVRLLIKENTDGRILLASDKVFISKDLCKMLDDCGEVLIMGATAGSNITDAVSRFSRQEDLSRAVVYDAVASEMVDAALQWIMDYFNRQLSRERKHCLKRRFSAGYGDFVLENQKIIYDLLELDRLNISLSPGYMLIPEKSVTAITGIKTAD